MDDASSCEISGCNIVSSGSQIRIGNVASEGDVVIVNDSILTNEEDEAYIWIHDPIDVTFNNCVFNRADSASTLMNVPIHAPTFNNPQWGWTQPTWSAWGAESASFDYATLTSGINTPPQPGIGYPSYTNYPTFLWGSTRTGIGTGYIPPSSPLHGPQPSQKLIV